MGKIYLINESNTNHYKIGLTKSNDVNIRKNSLQTANANELFICKTFETHTPSKLEKMLHKKFKSKNLMGEWFNLSDDDVLNFITTCQNLQNNIDYLLKSDNPFFK